MRGDKAKIEVRLANETVWLTPDQMAKLLQRKESTISKDGKITSYSALKLLQKMRQQPVTVRHTHFIEA